MNRKRLVHLIVVATILVSAAARCFAQSIAIASKPSPAPARWRGLIGEYGPDDDILIILESEGRLVALFKRTQFEPLDEVSKSVFRFPPPGAHAGQRLVFTRDAHGRATQVELEKVSLKRR